MMLRLFAFACGVLAASPSLGQNCVTEPPVLSQVQHESMLADASDTLEKQSRNFYRSAQHSLAVVIAVQDYEQSERYRSLKTPMEDAAAVAREMQHRGFETILCADPSAAQMEALMNTVLARVADGTRLMLWYSGHGSGDGNFVGSDGGGYAIGALLDAVVTRAAELGARKEGFHFLGLLINCHSRNALDDLDIPDPTRLDLQGFAGSARLITATTSGDNASGLTPDEGLIRMAFLRVLRGFDSHEDRSKGVMNTDELVRGVREELKRMSSSVVVGDAQVPLVRGEIGDPSNSFSFAGPKRIDWSLGARFRPCRQCPEISVIDSLRRDPSGTTDEGNAISALISEKDWVSCEQQGFCKPANRSAIGYVNVSQIEAQRYVDWLNDTLKLKQGRFDLPDAQDLRELRERSWRLMTVRSRRCGREPTWRADVDVPGWAQEAAEVGIYPWGANLLSTCIKQDLFGETAYFGLPENTWEWTATCTIEAHKPCRRAIILRNEQEDREWTGRSNTYIGFRVMFSFNPLEPS